MVSLMCFKDPECIPAHSELLRIDNYNANFHYVRLAAYKATHTGAALSYASLISASTYSATTPERRLSSLVFDFCTRITRLQLASVQTNTVLRRRPACASQILRQNPSYRTTSVHGVYATVKLFQDGFICRPRKGHPSHKTENYAHSPTTFTAVHLDIQCFRHC